MKRPVKILVVSSKYPPEYAGSGLRAHSTYKRLRERFGYQYETLCGSVAFNKTISYLFDGVPVHRVACKLFPDIKETEPAIIKRLKHAVNYIAEAALVWRYLWRRAEFDLIHVFGNNFVTRAALRYARIKQRPLIMEICNEMTKPSQYRDAHPARVVCISKRIEDACRKNGLLNDIWRRPNPVDTSRFYIDRENKFIFRKNLGLFGDRDIVLFNVGKICPLKNQIFLLDVLKRMNERYKLVIAGPVVGSGPDSKRDTVYFEELKRRIKILAVEERVKIIDRFIDNVDEYMKASDVYLLPSQIEACATPVLEAIACGIPVVAHLIEGVTTEWIKEGRNGYLAPLDADIFKKKIEMALGIKNSDLDESRDEIVSFASAEAIDKKYAEIISAMLKGREA